MDASLAPARRPGFARRWLKRFAWLFAGLALLFVALLAGLFMAVNRPPKSYPPSSNAIPPPSREDYARFELDGFESPYLGHTGSWDGKGGAMFGRSKTNDLDKEVEMGLRWTFTPVHWRALEPSGPVKLDDVRTNGVPPAWQALDAFVVEAQKRRLNILMQAPVVGGNAEGPPDWAGRREPGKSAPQNMAAAAEFVGKLALRYEPGGVLARQQGWGTRYGVRAWEIDNEPEMYRTHWDEQGGDYAELATRVAAKIKEVDSLALIVLPGVASGKHKAAWLDAALDAHALRGSPAFRSNAVPYSIGPIADGVSFHVYEGLDSAFSGTPRTIEVIFDEVRAIFERWETNSAGFNYAPKREYWHTEGNFDFIGALSEKRRAAWRIQFLTRAFAAGVRKVCIMDASPLERIAIRGYVQALPWPFPMTSANREVKILSGEVAAFRHMDDTRSDGGRVWVAWAVAGTGDAEVEIPVVRETVSVLQTDGSVGQERANGGLVVLRLSGDKKMAPPVIVVDRK